MDKVQLTKTVVSSLTAVTVTAVVRNIIVGGRRHSSNGVVEIVFDASAWLAAYALAGMVQERLDEYTNKRVDELVEALRSIKHPKPKIAA